MTMTENGNYIDEVVVIGYGTVKKRDLTGSVSSVKSDDLNLAVAPSVAHALQGKAAGLVISQNSAQPVVDWISVYVERVLSMVLKLLYT